MEKQFYFFKLIPPRVSFSKDMTDAERAIMLEHIQYWKELTTQGTSVLFGPVMEPQGGWGLGIIEVENEAAAKAIGDNDPSVLKKLNTFEVHPMRIGMIRTSEPA